VTLLLGVEIQEIERPTPADPQLAPIDERIDTPTIGRPTGNRVVSPQCY